MKPPDTDIPCDICKGSKRGELGQECGACFGTGLSTAPWDQRRNGTTVTLWEFEERKLPPGTEIHSQHYTERRRFGGISLERGTICLISWPNPNYRRHDGKAADGQLEATH